MGLRDPRTRGLFEIRVGYSRWPFQGASFADADSALKVAFGGRIDLRAGRFVPWLGAHVAYVHLAQVGAACSRSDVQCRSAGFVAGDGEFGLDYVVNQYVRFGPFIAGTVVEQRSSLDAGMSFLFTAR